MSSTYNTLTIVFLGLSVFVFLCALLMIARVIRPPAAFIPRTPTIIPTVELPTVTPTETPTVTPTPTDTLTPTPTDTLTPTDTPTPMPEPLTPTPPLEAPTPTETPQVQG
jgi:hypothetical protein